MSEVVRMWIGLLTAAIIIYLLVAPGNKTGDIIASLGKFNVGAIQALQGRGNIQTY